MERRRHRLAVAGWLVAALALAVSAMGGVTSMERTDKSFPPAGTRPLRLLFIHHSCGGQLLAAPGERQGGEPGSGRRCIYRSHPNGGDLRRLLVEAGYEVHELTYESALGADTDIGDWPHKFRDHLDELLATDEQDRRYDDGRTNHIIVFKSCYPNNDFVGEGTEPGDPTVPELTVANAKAAYRALLPVFRAHPEVLFVAMTAPPRAEPRSGLKDKLAALLGRKPRPADLAREFNTWLADRGHGWLAGYELPNVAVFDYYDVLTGHGQSNWSVYPTGDGTDSHPSREGNSAAAREFVPFLQQAVARMQAGE